MKRAVLLGHSGFGESHTGCHKIDQIGSFEQPWIPPLAVLGLHMSRADLSGVLMCTHAQDAPLGDGRAVGPVKQMTPGSQQMPAWAISLGWTKAMAGHGPQQGS